MQNNVTLLTKFISALENIIFTTIHYVNMKWVCYWYCKQTNNCLKDFQFLISKMVITNR